MKELIALIQKDPKWLQPRLECYLPRYLHFKEEWAPEPTSLGGKSQDTQGILAPGEILFINQRVGVRIQARYVSKETGGEGNSCLLPPLEAEKNNFPRLSPMKCPATQVGLFELLSHGPRDEFWGMRSWHTFKISLLPRLLCVHIQDKINKN